MTHPFAKLGGRDIFFLPCGGSKGMALLLQTPVMGAAHLCIQLCEKICPVCRVLLSLLETQAKALFFAIQCVLSQPQLELKRQRTKWGMQ